MVDVPFPVEKPKGKVVRATERTEGAVRTIIGGAPVAAVRRIVLYIVVEISLVLAPITPVAVVVGAVSVVLLIATDYLR